MKNNNVKRLRSAESFVFKPLDSTLTRKSLFLAGSIENCDSDNWQARFEKRFACCNVNVVNPRMDGRTTQSDTFQSREMINWELDHLDKVDIVLFNLLNDHLSPISLFELGLCAAKGKECYIICDKDYWKFLNVDMICARYGFPRFNTEQDAMEYIADKLLSYDCW